MTFTRRQTLIGVATTVAAGALPAVAVADVANGEVMLDPRHRFRDVVVGYTDRKGRDWFGRYDFIEMVRALHEADLITEYELVRLSGDRVMSIAKEDIKEGWYWVRNRMGRELFVVHVALEPMFETVDSSATLKVWHHGWDFSTELSEVMRSTDFIARIEPPEGT